ncbi:MAG: hypothetical protein LBT48_03390, partial [Prevotellaceae bacterium]|nr:hypothetical protein [Prevotellaceae bacterium]
LCSDNQLTALDVSKNTALRVLRCGGNELPTLDVSKNAALIELECYKNQLTKKAINALFSALPTYSYGRIWIDGNPGSADCTPSIAENKGWEVIR